MGTLDQGKKRALRVDTVRLKEQSKSFTSLYGCIKIHPVEMKLFPKNCLMRLTYYCVESNLIGLISLKRPTAGFLPS